jgi:quercetin dioxygenase-like cupin family protein
LTVSRGSIKHGAVESYQRRCAVKVRNYQEVAPDTEVPGVALRTVITADEAPRFSMRVLEVEVGGSTPFHTHEWEHEVFVLSGSGKVRSADGERVLSPNDAVFVAPDEEHCFTNTGDEVFRFVCCIPHSTLLAAKDSDDACEG